MTLPAGTRVGPYEIVALLGAGGMGEVYRARDTRLDRDVAVKILPDVFSADPERLARFEREAKTLASLNHPHIAQIYGLEANALVMELVDGEDLASRIARGAMPIDEAVPIARQIADALEAAHERGIVHRDLKPANVMLTAAGDVKVLDFGLAKAMDPPGGSGATHDPMNSPTITSPATQIGMILGTAAYMAPEQAKGKAVDKRADIWAFGVVLYEMLTGDRPFVGETITDVIAAIVTREPDWTALPPATPRSIRELLARCLEKDPRRRLRDIGEARLALERADAADPVPPALPPAAPLWRRALPWALAGLATAAAAVIGVAHFNEQDNPAAVTRFTVTPPFGASRPEFEFFEVSPDGHAVAFMATAADGRSRIFIRRFDEADARAVAGTENGARPFWSADSRSLGFTREGALYRTDLDDAGPRRLCAIPGVVESGAEASSGGTWGRRGVIVFTAPDGRLFQVPDNGGTPAPVTELDMRSGEAIHASPSFLPDGRHVLFLALTASSTRGVVWAVSIDNPERIRVTESSGGAVYVAGELLTTTASPRRLMGQPFDPERLTISGEPRPVHDQLAIANTLGRTGFSATSDVLVVERPAPQVHRLTWTDRAGRVLGTVGPAANIQAFALAPDDRRVVAEIADRSSRQSDLWLFDGPQAGGQRLTFQLDTRRPLWARDGKALYFTTMPGHGLWSLRLSGAAKPEPLENPGRFAHFEDITPRSDYLLFKSPSVPVGTVWMQRIGAPSERRALVVEPVRAHGPRVSPDGRWLAYSLSLPSGAEVFVQPFDRLGERQQVSTGGGFGPAWRADGRELFYETHGGLVAVTTSERGGALAFGPPQRLFGIQTQGLAANQPHNVEVAANGQRFLVNSIIGGSSNVPLEVTLNWRSAPRK